MDTPGLARYRVERADYPEPCDHHSKKQCRAMGPDRYGGFWHERPRWHVWDTQTDDYAAGTGPHQFERRRDAQAWADDRTVR